ncbi:hypothetical protein CYMTET_14082 [Cymbomonas tetramitiformis]|uniref:Asl1-like glycosyl hydrolase catalytic domain-containing protein n=1 Tax=Cymbomonas tetramitiformis TaxID=36881 RepID=A0AAE0GH26_9CHLO|nr:hypothetical protein CYMTET_14082 [Cymbomonas tetramitiformis]|eukprot:gene2440-3173_t
MPPPPPPAPADISYFKRGFARKAIDEDDLALLQGVTSWGYTWEVIPSRVSLDKWDGNNVTFLPMIWGSTQATNNLDEIPEAAEALLGFNEPNFDAQANLLPAEAAALWPEIEARAADLTIPLLVGPAVNFSPDSPYENPVLWYEHFFENCTGCRVDMIAMHTYVCYGAALQYMLDLYKVFGKLIWVTEFACEDTRARQSMAGQMEYMKEAVAILEHDEWVYRYAWFRYLVAVAHACPWWYLQR